jgi:hypothetical protein
MEKAVPCDKRIPSAPVGQISQIAKVTVFAHHRLNKCQSRFTNDRNECCGHSLHPSNFSQTTDSVNGCRLLWVVETCCQTKAYQSRRDFNGQTDMLAVAKNKKTDAIDEVLDQITEKQSSPLYAHQSTQ